MKPWEWVLGAVIIVVLLVAVSLERHFEGFENTVITLLTVIFLALLFSEKR